MFTNTKPFLPNNNQLVPLMHTHNEVLLPKATLPPKLYRGLLMLTASWSGERVAEGSLLFKVHNVANATKLPLIWCGGPPEMPVIIGICGKDRSIYGLRGTYDFVEPTHEVITSLSQYYADEIEAYIPSKTILIAGYCAAAYIAIEVATLLKQRGFQIGYLGLVDRDVTEKTLFLRLGRKLFDWIDRLGALAYTIAYMRREKVMRYNLDTVQVLKQRVLPTVEANDPRLKIKYVKKPDDAMYLLKPYDGKVNLFFIQWGVFGFYQMNVFKRYWHKIAKGGLQVDFIKGYSHKYPSWPKIIRSLNRRLAETGF